INKPSLVVGGSASLSRDGFQSFTFDDQVRLSGPTFSTGTFGTRTIDGSTKSELSSISLIAARRLGFEGRTSLGFGFDHLRTNGSLLSTITQTDLDKRSSIELADTRSVASRSRFTFGLTHELRDGPKLGIFYRYGSVSAEDRDRSRTFNGENRLLNRTSVAGR